MQIGFNNDVQYRGKTFHIQTEDHGVKMASIETQIFHAGAIYDTSIVSYKKLLADSEEGDERIKRIRNMMQANHKSLYNKLKAGEYDKFAGLEPLEGGEVEVEDFVPSQERVPESAHAFEKGEGDFPEQQEGEHVSLADIQKKLLEDQEAADRKSDAESTNPTSATQATTSSSLSDKLQVVKEKIKEKKNTKSLPSFDLPTTGPPAYRGCSPSKEDFAISDLVEIFLAS